NKHLKKYDGPVKDFEGERLKPQQLKVLARLPADAINDVVHERFRRPARLEIPQADEVAKRWGEGKAPELEKALLERCFRGWPAKAPALEAKAAGEVTHKGVRVKAYDFVSEEGYPLRVWLVRHEKIAPTEVIASVVDEGGWREWLADLGPAF